MSKLTSPCSAMASSDPHSQSNLSVMSDEVASGDSHSQAAQAPESRAPSPPVGLDGRANLVSKQRKLLAAKAPLKRHATSAQQAQAKRQKRAVEDDLVCPITLELPFDPVTAEDGRVYERSAIQEHIDKNKGSNLKSPLTMEKMGQRLFRAIQHKNIIEVSIHNGVITGDLAIKWLEKAQQKTDMDYLVTQAEGGDVKAMEKVARRYHIGAHGFKQNNSAAYLWYQKAHAAGSVKGMAKEGELLVLGVGVAKDSQRGMTYLGIAVGMGSDLAAFVLGEFFAGGKYGYPWDTVLARRYLEKSLSDESHLKHMGDCSKKMAQQMLDEL